MARKPTAPSLLPDKILSEADKRAGVKRLERRIDELGKVEVEAINEWAPSDLSVLETAIEETLARIFGQGTPSYLRYVEAATLCYSERFGMISLGGPPPPRTPIAEVRSSIKRKIERALGLLNQAARGLQEDLDELADSAEAATLKSGPAGHGALSPKVFVVHGRDTAPRLEVAAFLRKVGLEPIILHEQASESRTVIEKIEAHSEVGFAVVLLTPDDVGGLKGEAPRPRARQNVLLELGYFVGKLTRRHVCAFACGDVEIPSDWAGVISEHFDERGAWKMVLVKELKAAGHKPNVEAMFD